MPENRIFLLLGHFWYKFLIYQICSLYFAFIISFATNRKSTVRAIPIGRTIKAFGIKPDIINITNDIAATLIEYGS